MRKQFAYSVTYTVYDDSVNAHRQKFTWIKGSRGQPITPKGIIKLINSCQKNANVIRFQRFIDER